jgi:hypothetical protein
MSCSGKIINKIHENQCIKMNNKTRENDEDETQGTIFYENGILCLEDADEAPCNILFGI